jgi:hypothetical protein
MLQITPSAIQELSERSFARVVDCHHGSAVIVQ